MAAVKMVKMVEKVEMMEIKVLASKVSRAFCAIGAGWQSRIDAALHEWLRRHSPV